MMNNTNTRRHKLVFGYCRKNQHQFAKVIHDLTLLFAQDSDWFINYKKVNHQIQFGADGNANNKQIVNGTVNTNYATNDVNVYIILLLILMMIFLNLKKILFVTRDTCLRRLYRTFAMLLETTLNVLY